MNDQKTSKLKSIAGKTSLICGLGAIILTSLGFLSAVVLSTPVLFFAPVLFSFILVIIGILSALVGLFSKRALFGLTLNLLLVLGGAMFYLIVFLRYFERPEF